MTKGRKHTMILTAIATSLIGSGFRMAAQDFYGLDGWIAVTRRHWIEMSPAWGIGLVVIGLALVVVAVVRTPS